MHRYAVYHAYASNCTCAEGLHFSAFHIIVVVVPLSLGLQQNLYLTHIAKINEENLNVICWENLLYHSPIPGIM